jgi:hypothetical protein
MDAQGRLTKRSDPANQAVPRPESPISYASRFTHSSHSFPFASWRCRSFRLQFLIASKIRENFMHAQMLNSSDDRIREYALPEKNLEEPTAFALARFTA